MLIKPGSIVFTQTNENIKWIVLGFSKSNILLKSSINGVEIYVNNSFIDTFCSGCTDIFVI